MSFVLPGLLWWRQLKQTHSPSGTGVINCHMWMNKGTILKLLWYLLMFFIWVLKRPNNSVVSWCMWLMALQNEGNFSPLDFSRYFALFLVLGFWWKRVYSCRRITLVLYWQTGFVFVSWGGVGFPSLKDIFFHTEEKMVLIELSRPWPFGKKKSNVYDFLAQIKGKLKHNIHHVRHLFIIGWWHFFINY